MTCLLAFGVLGDTGSSGLRSHVEKIPLMLYFSNFRAIWIHLVHKYPPTPAASRGSTLEEDLLATRGQKRKADKQEEQKKPEAARSGQARRREEDRSG
jgi:hypothetical protein